jgi:HlyD family secretion protein
MSNRAIENVVERVRSLLRPTNEHSDGELLSRFIRSRDEDAFRLLAERHAGMVLSVCRRVLNDPQDAEDACQATLLILASILGSLRLTATGVKLYELAQRTKEKP